MSGRVPWPCWIIPAHAGFTPGSGGPPSWWSDHPRTRGVYLLTGRIRRTWPGSSPHTRGLRRARPHRPGGAGIIPAHAGFTPPAPPGPPALPDHPRTRGVCAPGAMRVVTTSGSSPHTRGLHGGRGPAGAGGRIIPAHAGFTPRWWGTRAGVSDHPRTRGVYYKYETEGTYTYGSSPHTRGLRDRFWWDAGETGIIPAHAGFTRTGPPPGRRPGDHPRTRGVYVPREETGGWEAGSSPHTRGLLHGTLIRSPLSRIIPAHAGFTHGRQAARPEFVDHPRTRGVYFSCLEGSVGEGGSSPHTRGLQDGGVPVDGVVRIIPAHAGFTP